MAGDADLKFPWKRYAAALRRLGDEGVKKQMKRAMAKTGDAYEAEAVALAPHDKGFLESNTNVVTNDTSAGIQTVVSFGANYAAEVHELPPHRRGKKTREKPSTKFGAPGPKYLERVLRGMDFEFFIGNAYRDVLKEWAAKQRRARRRG